MAVDLDSMFFSFGNVHIISGPNGKCECGKDGKTCSEQLASVASKYMELNAKPTNTQMPSASQIAAKMDMAATKVHGVVIIDQMMWNASLRQLRHL